MTVLSTADVATELGTDGRTLRRFLRSITPKDEQPGKGSRWNIEKKSMRSLKSQFATWTAAQDEKRAANAEVADAEDAKHTEVASTAGTATS